MSVLSARRVAVDVERRASFTPPPAGLSGSVWNSVSQAKPLVELMLASTDIENAIRKTNRYDAVRSTVQLFENAILDHLRADERRPDVWLVVCTAPCLEGGSSVAHCSRRRCCSIFARWRFKKAFMDSNISRGCATPPGWQRR